MRYGKRLADMTMQDIEAAGERINDREHARHYHDEWDEPEDIDTSYRDAFNEYAEQRLAELDAEEQAIALHTERSAA